MNAAHLFYIPVCILVGLMAGYFIGRRAAEQDMQTASKRDLRRERMQRLKASRHEAGQRNGAGQRGGTSQPEGDDGAEETE